MRFTNLKLNDCYFSKSNFKESKKIFSQNICKTQFK